MRSPLFRSNAPFIGLFITLTRLSLIFRKGSYHELTRTDRG
jgi:biopolymer transport protein ExbB/TolQ